MKITGKRGKTGPFGGVAMGIMNAKLTGFFVHFSLKCTKKGQCLHFPILKIAEKEGRTDLVEIVPGMRRRYGWISMFFAMIASTGSMMVHVETLDLLRFCAFFV